jgi:hypothetical protein
MFNIYSPINDRDHHNYRVDFNDAAYASTAVVHISSALRVFTRSPAIARTPGNLKERKATVRNTAWRSRAHVGKKIKKKNVKKKRVSTVQRPPGKVKEEKNKKEKKDSSVMERRKPPMKVLIIPACHPCLLK